MFDTNAAGAPEAPSRHAPGEDIVIQHLESGGYRAKGRFFARLSDVIDEYGWGESSDHGHHNDRHQHDPRGVRVGGAYVDVKRV